MSRKCTFIHIYFFNESLFFCPVDSMTHYLLNFTCIQGLLFDLSTMLRVWSPLTVFHCHIFQTTDITPNMLTTCHMVIKPAGHRQYCYQPLMMLHFISARLLVAPRTTQLQNEVYTCQFF